MAMEESPISRHSTVVRSGLVVTGGLLSLLAAYGLYRLWTRLSSKDEYFDHVVNVRDQAERKILVVGLDGAGKTRFARCFCKGRHRLSSGEETTVGFYINSVQLGQIHLNMWDVGGSKNCRQYWGNFLNDMDAICYVVDSSDPGRFQEAKAELHRFLSDSNTKNLPVAIIATKQDVPGAVKPRMVLEALDMERFSQNHSIHLIGVQAPDDGPRKGFADSYNFFVSLPNRPKKNL